MLFIDKLRRREPTDETHSLRGERADSRHFVSRKIIDFESARRALERDSSTWQNVERQTEPVLGNLTDRSSAVAESLVTIVLALIIALSLLLGMIWGF